MRLSRRRVQVGAALVVAALGAATGCSGSEGESVTDASAGFVGLGTTGHHDLSTASGDLRITTPGEVIDGYDVTGTITVEADDVTIRNTRIRTWQKYGVSAGEGTSGLVVEDVTIVGTTMGCSAAIGPNGSWTLRRSDISGCVDGIKVRSGQVVEGNWVHDLRIGELPDGSWAHNDAIQSTSGSNVRIVGNNLEVDWAAGGNAAIMLSTNFGSLSGYTVTGNRFAGGQYVVSVRDQGYGDPSVTFTDNVWVYGDWNFGPTNFEGTTVSLGPGNRYDTGDPIG